MGLMMMHIDGILDAWWKLASIFSGGMLGLFLLGVVCRNVKRVHAVVAVILGLLVIAWMSLSPLINEGSLQDFYLQNLRKRQFEFKICIQL